MKFIKTQKELISESIFFKSFEERIHDIRRNIVKLLSIRHELLVLTDVYNKKKINPIERQKFNEIYTNYYLVRVEILEKFIKVVERKNINQNELNTIIIQWKRFVEDFEHGSYTITIGDDLKYLKKTLNLLNYFLIILEDLKQDFNIDLNVKDIYVMLKLVDNDYRPVVLSKKKEIEKKRKEKHADVDPFGEEQWGGNESFNYPINELFDADNIYEYKFISKENKKDDDLLISRYEFTSKSNDKYYVRLFHYFSDDPLNYYKSFVSIDFLKEYQYKDQKDNFDFEDYANTQKFDAIKIINTVFNILKQYIYDNNIEVVSFNCDEYRYKTYKYLINKYFKDYLLFESIREENDKHVFDLFSTDVYIADGNENIIRKDNNKKFKATRK